MHTRILILGYFAMHSSTITMYEYNVYDEFTSWEYSYNECDRRGKSFIQFIYNSYKMLWIPDCTG